jgi:hypothetical protein
VREVASQKVISATLRAYLDDRNLSEDDFGDLVGISGRQVRRIIDRQVERPHRSTRWGIARQLGEDPSTFWPPMPGKRQPGGSRRRVAA